MNRDKDFVNSLKDVKRLARLDIKQPGFWMRAEYGGDVL